MGKLSRGAEPVALLGACRIVGARQVVRTPGVSQCGVQRVSQCRQMPSGQREPSLAGTKLPFLVTPPGPAIDDDLSVVAVEADAHS